MFKMSDTIKQLTQAVTEVIVDVKTVDKSLEVGMNANSKYMAVSDADVKIKLGQSMANHGLALMPIDSEEECNVDSWFEETQYGKKRKQQVFTKVKVYYLLSHVSGEYITLVGRGHGIDSQDKSIGKALTYSEKYTMLHTFMVASGAIDDSDTTHSDSHNIPAYQTNGIVDNRIDPSAQGEELEKQLVKAIIAISKRIEPSAPASEDDFKDLGLFELKDTFASYKEDEKNFNAKAWIVDQLEMPKKSGSKDALNKLWKEAQAKGFLTEYVKEQILKKGEELDV
jgi:hypothetical protein